MRKFSLVLAAIILMATQVHAQTIRAEATMADGSFVVLAASREQSLEVQTKYGKLTVPFAEIRRIEFGHHVRPGETEKIEASVKKLGSSNFAERDTASKLLANYGEEAWYVLQQATKHPDKEVTNRVDKILSQLSGITIRKQTDTVLTQEGTIVGRISNETIKATSTHFGELVLRPCDMREFRVHDKREVEFSIDAEKYGLSNQWLDTGINLMLKEKIDLIATGTVDLFPLEPGRYTAGPDGANQYSGRSTQRKAGSLVAKIGEKGETFPATDLLRFGPWKEGRLYLRIVESPWDCPSIGIYQVVIRLGGRKP